MAIEKVQLRKTLDDMDAPRKIIEAADIIESRWDVGPPPHKDLVQYVNGWVNRNRGNNRYGH